MHAISDPENEKCKLLDEQAICRTLGIKILRNAEDEEMLESDFMRVWSAEVPIYMNPNLEDLTGHAIVKKRDNQSYIQSLSIWELSSDVGERFQQFFRLRTEWPRNDLEAYLR